MRYWQTSSGSSSYPVIFDSLKSISDDAKVSEAMDILIAGADTTASTLTTGFLHILSNDRIKSRLVQAIDEAMPDTGSLISLQALEKVEYLVCDGLRTRNPNKNPTDNFQVGMCQGVNQSGHGRTRSSTSYCS